MDHSRRLSRAALAAGACAAVLGAAAAHATPLHEPTPIVRTLNDPAYGHGATEEARRPSWTAGIASAVAAFFATVGAFLRRVWRWGPKAARAGGAVAKAAWTGVKVASTGARLAGGVAKLGLSVTIALIMGALSFAGFAASHPVFAAAVAATALVAGGVWWAVRRGTSRRSAAPTPG